MPNWKGVLVTLGLILLILTGLFFIFLPNLPIDLDNSTFYNGYQLENAFPELEFSTLVHVTHAGDGTDYLYAVQQTGEIFRFLNDPNVIQKELFLDISTQVRSNGEMGLLGLTFHPNFSKNGLFYVDYTISDPRRTRISQFTATAGVGDPSSETVIFEISQPYPNHNAGAIEFGPDNLLYITLGDGGAGGDPDENGQDPSTYLGSILRIDVDRSENGLNYAIPPDNPFVNDSQKLDEIFAYGFRNPWKISFDNHTGQLWAGDVGQNSFEEIDIVKAGLNYGWNTMEGFACFDPAENCDRTGLELPVIDYPRKMGKAVSGGYVYRGTQFPEFQGRYFYADFISGRIWHLNASNPSEPDVVDLMKVNMPIPGFLQDQANEIYVINYEGSILRFVAV